MMNALGKLLVLIHTGLAFVGLAWAAGLYLSFVDWGWKEPGRSVDLRTGDERKGKNNSPRIASEIDKRQAALNQAAKARDRVVPAIEKNRSAWHLVAQQFPKNHLAYVAELNRLYQGDGPLVIKGVQYKDGDPVLEPALIGAPVLANDIAGLNKSYRAYESELKKILALIKNETDATQKWLSDAQKITAALVTVKDDKGKAISKGLYDLLEDEFEAQRQAKFEKDYLQPNWSRALEEAELFRDRRGILEETLERLKNRKD